ncbi:nitric oxide synthase, salivary gland isoform X2 [Daktulosphaira vitifoliae]|uniref:nitric oxide synthase, salivary gland isoform X2 n=1 Tax=Daktulosphaira vitifoliae TaxID=58002 RepID=UPI0021A9EB32|nr:nitric oxide synthase, salivary gland isoform X2 [Daktulosphaira vitifoliae]
MARDTPDEKVSLELVTPGYVKRGSIVSNRFIDLIVDGQHTDHSNITIHKPIKLKNYSAKAEVFDTLHQNSKQAASASCTHQVCMGSVMYPISYPNSLVKPKHEVLKLADDFLNQYFASIKRSNSPAHTARWEQVQQEVLSTGTYQLTETELVFGAKLAWRNASRCIGRIQWAKLQVFDCRSVTTTSSMFEAICNHIKYSTNKGNIRSAITVFQQRTDGRHDFRVWNAQLISYAGYKQPDGTFIGDPMNAEFTEVCMKLGWRGKGTKWDLLPLVLSANGHDPDYFDLPRELILEVKLVHPRFDWFADLGLRWYCLPAVSSMMFECGGIQFTACPFNGWYMSTEIGCRNLCDTYRYNVLDTVLEHMRNDVNHYGFLKKDRALVEVNLSVLYSFQSNNITIMDHHTACESFMKHYDNELRTRKGCPADWVWIVPPISGSITPVFHQEMANYELQPTYSYQEAAWKTHVWKKGQNQGKTSKKQRRKFHFKQIARAVKFTSKLFGQALSRRIKATILYATETGRSEIYAKKLGEIFAHAFHSQVMSMEEYDMTSIEHEALLLVVASTFGNGDPPENGQEFAQQLYSLKMEHEVSYSNKPLIIKSSPLSSASFIKANSLSEIHFSELNDSFNKDSTDIDNFGPLGNVRFAVFGLGSSAYPNFCSFGSYVDNLLSELGGEQLMKLAKGDEMCGQEQAFKKWATEVFHVACDTFCLDMDETLSEASQVLHSEKLSASTVRFVHIEEEDLHSAYTRYHNKKVWRCKLNNKQNLMSNSEDSRSDRVTLWLEMNVDEWKTVDKNMYEPGDHVGMFAENRSELVNGIIQHLGTDQDPDQAVELQILKEKHTSTGVLKNWIAHEKLPRCSLRTLLTRFLDITTPPSPNMLQFLASFATNPTDCKKLTHLAIDSSSYEDWRHWRLPNLLEVFHEFPSAKPPAALLVAQLTPLQPRFYSISSASQLYPHQVHLTVAVVTYRTQGGKGPIHYGVCSNFLLETNMNDTLYMFVRSAPNFHLPKDVTKPLILVGPGTGIAPFRAFWQHRYAQNKKGNDYKIGRVILFFGCQYRSLELYKSDKKTMLEEGVLDKVYLALSREPSIPKTYVQDLMLKESKMIYELIAVERGHFYVCGDCKMAENVYQTLKSIIQEQTGMNSTQSDNFMLGLRDDNRYHEDIFGITLRTAEVHHKSRETARIRMASESVP